jgi:hypothetical protein
MRLDVRGQHWYTCSPPFTPLVTLVSLGLSGLVDKLQFTELLGK